MFFRNIDRTLGNFSVKVLHFTTFKIVYSKYARTFFLSYNITIILFSSILLLNVHKMPKGSKYSNVLAKIDNFVYRLIFTILITKDLKNKGNLVKKLVVLPGAVKIQQQ